MYKLDLDEKAITRVLEQLSYKTSRWPENEDPFCDKILYQRFGSELREEDLEESSLQFKDFSLRDRNDTKKNSSGFSEVRYEENRFKFQLDVWPFKINELSVIETHKYFLVKGEHKERSEDGSQCARSFQRYYRVPKGSKVVDCGYSNGILTILVARNGIVDEPGKMRMVPITLVASKENGSAPIEGKRSPAAITDDVREVTISIADSDNKEPDAGVAKSPEGELSSSEDSKSSKDVDGVKIVNLLKEVETSEDPRIKGNEAIKSAVKTICEAFESKISESDNSVQETTESVEKSSVDNVDPEVGVTNEEERKKSE